MREKYISPRLLALMAIGTAMISIQSGAALAKQLFPVAGPQGATALRLLFASLMLLIVWRPWRSLPKRREWRAIFLYGFALGCMNLTFYLALARIPLGIAVALEFTGPLAIALLGSRKALDFLWVLCATIGIVLLLPVTRFSGSLDPAGIVYALVAGLFWALYILFGKKASNAVHGGMAPTLGMCTASLITFPAGFSHCGFGLFSNALLPTALAVALFASALPYSLEMFALGRLPTRTFSIVMSLEPAVATLSGLLFLNERLNAVQCIAIALVIIASAGCTWSDSAAEITTEMTP